MLTQLCGRRSAADFKFRAAPAIHPNSAPIVAPAIVEPAFGVATLPEQSDSTARIRLAVTTAAVVGRAGQHIRAGAVAAVAIPVAIQTAIVPPAIPAVAPASLIESALPLPDQIERIALASSFGILYANDRDAPVLARIANELDSAATVNSLESEICRILRHDT